MALNLQIETLKNRFSVEKFEKRFRQSNNGYCGFFSSFFRAAVISWLWWV